MNAILKGGKAGMELGLEEASVKQKKKGVYRGWDSSIRLKNPTAKIVIKASDKPPSFAFRPINETVNPRQQIKLYPFVTQKTVPGARRRGDECLGWHQGQELPGQLDRAGIQEDQQGLLQGHSQR